MSKQPAWPKRAAVIKLALSVKTPPAAPEAAADPGAALDQRPITRQALAFGAEIRSRIAEHGTITGGIFGDPPPGRSALDKRRIPLAPGDEP